MSEKFKLFWLTFISAVLVLAVIATLVLYLTKDTDNSYIIVIQIEKNSGTSVNDYNYC